uniref:Potassium channel domain-containing protein n=1 Tax=Tetranychus urticae TaxID=32264 RepID=T1L5P7_TETUR
MAYDRRTSKRKSGRHHHRSRKLDTSISHRPRSSGEKCKDYCRKFVAFLFSHIGISAIVVAYMIGGALLFQRLEGEASNDINISVGEMIIDSVDQMWIITNEINILNKQAWDQIMRNETNSFAINLIKQIQSGFDNKPRNNKWEFPGAFLFCLTVITTIGKFHIILHGFHITN